jgi:hypothetical protein
VCVLNGAATSYAFAFGNIIDFCPDHIHLIPDAGKDAKDIGFESRSVHWDMDCQRIGRTPESNN